MATDSSANQILCVSYRQRKTPIFLINYRCHFWLAICCSVIRDVVNFVRKLFSFLSLLSSLLMRWVFYICTPYANSNCCTFARVSVVRVFVSSCLNSRARQHSIAVIWDERWSVTITHHHTALICMNKKNQMNIDHIGLFLQLKFFCS